MPVSNSRVVIVSRQGLGPLGVFVAVLGGAVAGALAALLMAPRSGAEMRAWFRELLMGALDKSSSRLEQQSSERASAHN